MKTTMKFFMYGMLAMAITTTSCSKEGIDGPIGPTGIQGEQGVAGPEGPHGPAGQDGEALGLPGPKGDAGATGPAGTDGTDGSNGTNGTNGEDGNANVIASDWIPTEFVSGAALVSTFEVLLTNFTDEMANSALITAYGKRLVNGGTTERVYQLPVNFPQGNYRFYVEDNNADGVYEMNFEAITPDGNFYVYDRFVEVRYIIVPASTTTGKTTDVDLNKMNYYEVMDYFGLEY